MINVNQTQTSTDSNDDTRSSSTAFSNTIWSSVPSSSRVSPSNSTTDRSNHIMLSSTSSLSFNPGMIDSSTLSIDFNHDANRSFVGADFSNEDTTELDALSINSGYSYSSISSCSVASIPDHSPHLVTNIGRALLQLSANENDSTDGSSASDVLSHTRDLVSESRDRGEWWTRFQTEEDWESFNEMAAQYLSTLVAAELMEMEKEVERDRDPWKMKKVSNCEVVRYGCRGDSYSIATMLLQRIYRAISSIMGAESRDLHVSCGAQRKMNYISYLVKELASVQLQLNTLPPIPPTLPCAIDLGELPEDARNILTKHCLSWRAETMKEREILELKQSTCREEVLSAIIEAEEELFWSKDDANEEKLGSLNDDGYFHVVDGSSPYWNGLEDAYDSGRKCRLGFRYFVALTAGAAGIASFLLQSKRR